MIDWDKIRIFHATADAGSFTRAGEKLYMSQSAVSRQISTLEDSMGVKLFLRHARGLALTEAGERLYGSANRMSCELQDVENYVADTREKPTGPLMVTTNIGFGSTWLTNRLAEFLDQNPNMQLSLKLTDTDLDLALRESDVAIWLHQPVQSELIQTKLFTVHFHLFASEKYIAKHGEPQNIDDLDQHRIVIFGYPSPSHLEDLNWLEHAGSKGMSHRQPALKVNSVYAMRQAVRHGIGIAMLPDYIVDKTQGMVRIMNQTNLPEFDTYFVYPPELRQSKRITVFLKFLRAKAREWTF